MCHLRLRLAFAIWFSPPLKWRSTEAEVEVEVERRGEENAREEGRIASSVA